MSKMKIAAALLGGLLTSAYAGGAQASIVYNDFNGVNVTPTNSLIIDNFTVTTSPGGVFEQKQLGGSSGVGVSNGNSVVPGEIDGQEYISFVSNIGIRLLSAFTVSFLYAAPAYSDIVNESAFITIDSSTYLLSLTDATHANFSFGPGATVTMLSEGSEGNGGEWQVKFTNPLSFASIQFSPGPNGGTTSPQADYAFGSLTTAAAVPGPIVGAGLPGLMMALGGLVVLARRRRNQACV
jgi:hypothetical protein